MEDTCRHVFVTGRAGTGKSTLLTHFRRTTRKNVVVLAPTGVAAVNVGGQTIHSFFGFKPDVTPGSVRKKGKDERKNLYKRLTTIVIDEVSMVRADLLDCVDKFLRLNGPDCTLPFGGVQMILIGDLYQLPPVVKGEQKALFRSHYGTPYFFSAKAMESLDIVLVELERVYRQTDDEFIRLLNAIRNRTATDGDIAAFNRRCDPEFVPPPKDYYIYLTSTNELANGINEARLAKLKGKAWISQGVIEGDFGAEYLPTAVDLRLKQGAQIMLLNNDSSGRWINGTIARVTGFVTDGDGQELIAANLETGEPVSIAPYRWEIYRFFLKDGELASEIAGTFTHFPVRLAFAVTIHKSQGKTFKKAVIDVGQGRLRPWTDVRGPVALQESGGDRPQTALEEEPSPIGLASSEISDPISICPSGRAVPQGREDPDHRGGDPQSANSGDRLPEGQRRKIPPVDQTPVHRRYGVQGPFFSWSAGALPAAAGDEDFQCGPHSRNRRQQCILGSGRRTGKV